MVEAARQSPKSWNRKTAEQAEAAALVANDDEMAADEPLELEPAMTAAAAPQAEAEADWRAERHGNVAVKDEHWSPQRPARSSIWSSLFSGGSSKSGQDHG